MSVGAVIVAPHFGHGAETPAKWVGTRNFASQFVQVNLIFFTSLSLKIVSALIATPSPNPLSKQTREQGGGLDKIDCHAGSRIGDRHKILTLIRRNARFPLLYFKIKEFKLSLLRNEVGNYKITLLTRFLYASIRQGTRIASRIPWSIFLSDGQIVARTPPRVTPPFTALTK